MYNTNEIKKLYDRLKEQYPQYEMDFSDNCLTITLLHGKVELNREKAKLYVNRKLYDEFTSEEVRDSDDIYELIELFILQLQQIGMDSGNETYIGAKKKAAQLGTRFMFLVSLIVSACILAMILTNSLWWVIPIFLCPLAAFILLGLIHKKTFIKYWVCPKCGCSLPLDKKSHFPKMEYVSQCPHCSQVLEKPPEIEPILLDTDVPRKQLEPDNNLPVPGNKWPCYVTGGITIVIGLLLMSMLFISDDPISPIGMVVAVILLLILLGFGLALLLCRHREPEEWRHPIVVMRERKIVIIICGMIEWLIGFICMVFAIICAGTSPFDGGFTFFLALVGIPLTLLGTWMLLAQRNRSLFVFRDNSIMYISSFGRVRNFEPGQVVSVRMTVNHSIHLLDRHGKKLASVETNMQGASRFADWIESTDMMSTLTPAMEQQSMNKTENKNITQWREEYRTPLHNHLGVIRLGLVIVIMLFAVGSVVPYLLYLFADLKISHAIYLTSFSPIPMFLYYIAFAPVIMIGGAKSDTTDEWKAMHIKFPINFVLLLDLLIFGQTYYFWEEWILQIMDTGRFMLLTAVISAVLITLFCIRTPKHMRKQDDFAIMILSLMMLGFVMSFGLNLAISKPVEHYPAVVVDRHIPVKKKRNSNYTLTVKLNDGSTKEVNVSEHMYNLEKEGVKFVVCQKENFLGIRMIRLHIPKGTDIDSTSNSFD